MKEGTKSEDNQTVGDEQFRTTTPILREKNDHRMESEDVKEENSVQVRIRDDHGTLVRVRKEKSVLPANNGRVLNDDENGRSRSSNSKRPITVRDWEYSKNKEKSSGVVSESNSTNSLMHGLRYGITQAFSMSDEESASPAGSRASGSLPFSGSDTGDIMIPSGTDDKQHELRESPNVAAGVDNNTEQLYVDEHLEKYFREVTFAADVNNNTERFHALFSTNIAPHGTHVVESIKNGTGSTERGAYVVTTDESVYFIARLSSGDNKKRTTFADRPEFSTIARYSLSDVCRVNIGFFGQRLRIDFVDASWDLVTRNKHETYHFVQKVMPMVKTKRIASRRRGTLKMPRNPLAMSSTNDVTTSPNGSKHGVEYTNEDQLTLEHIHASVIGKGAAGRSSGKDVISTRVKMFLMLYERPNPSAIRLVRHVPKNRRSPRTLVITESALYLCDEDYSLEWPRGSSPFNVLRSALLKDCLELVLKADQRDVTLVIATPVVGFVKANKRWRLRCATRDIKDQLVNLLKSTTSAVVV
jgi:hypothetical protein